MLGTVAGLYFSFRLKMRVDSLRELTQVLREMAMLIRHRALPVKDLFSEMSRYEFVAQAGSSVGADFRAGWLKAADSLAELSENERAVVKSVGMALGTSDVAGQIAMLEVNAGLLAGFAVESNEQYLKKGKLYRTCGVLAGLFLAVLII